MKDRKTLGHNDLINEVTRLMANRFNPQPQMIKRRIEQLIEVRGRINPELCVLLKKSPSSERIPREDVR